MRPDVDRLLGEGRQLKALYLFVGDRSTGMCGYAWRLGSGGSSFYIKPIAAALSEFKISLHGPDPRSNRRPGYKVAIDSAATPAAVAAGGALAASEEWLPKRWFEGQEVAAGVRRVLRIRTTWDLFNRRLPSAPVPADLKSRNVGAFIPAPRSLHALDVDLYACERRPHWAQ